MFFPFHAMTKARKKAFSMPRKICFHRITFCLPADFLLVFLSWHNQPDDHESFVFGVERRRSTLSARLSSASSMADTMQKMLQVSFQEASIELLLNFGDFSETTKSTAHDEATTSRHPLQASTATPWTNQFGVGLRRRTCRQTKTATMWLRSQRLCASDRGLRPGRRRPTSTKPRRAKGQCNDPSKRLS